MLWNLPNITVSVEPLFYIGPLPFTSTLLLAIVNAIFIFVLFFLFSRRKKLLPGRVQGGFEWLVQSMLGLCQEVAGKRKGRIFFPWVFGIFIVMLLANLWEVIPGVDTIGIDQHRDSWLRTCRIRRTLSGRQERLQLHHTAAAATINRSQLHAGNRGHLSDRHPDLWLAYARVQGATRSLPFVA